MKKNTVQELRNKDVLYLRQRVREACMRQERLRFDIRSGKTNARKEENELRREIAVAWTLITEKETHHHE